ncbi:MAG: DUF1538 domain-containing protein [Treponema sp.]|uniref:DUF1538 domain-containing protein n=1 Tax=Treponema sp. TaxID=166 RepID=UPI0025DD1C5B|nr:DUF1538 domain-containing protein [Treponema sp.]MBR0496887.1 DUF1538 domain-containing protein [Treponema sp.]
MNIFAKFKETAFSVLPVMIVVVLLGLTIAPLHLGTMTRFVLGGILVIFGLTLFLLGVDIGILPIGERSGAALTAKRSLKLLLAAAFLIGFIVTVAEPDVQVLADQVRAIAPGVSKWGLILMIAVGVGFFVALGILRTVLSIPLNILLTVSYIGVFALAFCAPATFQGVAFDSGGATTGPMTVPFIMALGVGVAAVRSKTGKNGKIASSAEDSFGLTGIASIGPVLAVIVYGISIHATSDAAISGEAAGHGLIGHGIFVFLNLLPSIFMEVATALAPLAAMAALFQIFLLKMPPMQVVRMVRGFVLSFVGLVLFLCGAHGGFMPAGEALGEVLGEASLQGSFWTALLVAVGVVFGAIVVCAEPAVWVLTDQVESISGGTIKRKVMLVALSAGVALSIGISMCRVLFGFSLWYILIPGYALALVLSFIAPKLFTAIAFDSGGVASGPMTSTFILSFTLGASSASGGNPSVDAFGVIALVAMTPLIAIQILGIIFKVKSNRSEKAKIAAGGEE